ncbi:hypothetical protein F511_27172 [Dorcoceras hygrometricum]|uniref:Uncharacterized protein n=1 Tax=Dorcoceras hygrometricum TaxID=472368 RepID=A0A2Z7DBE1_9LAMI|nr:hypothetical protein F511_27172 [Dorcoceras hygrometricum]
MRNQRATGEAQRRNRGVQPSRHRRRLAGARPPPRNHARRSSARGRDKRGAPSPSCAIAWRTSVGNHRATAPRNMRNQRATGEAQRRNRGVEKQHQAGPPIAQQAAQFTAMHRPPCPRPETGFLRQPALEGLTRSAWTDSPRQDWPEQILAKRRRRAPGGGGEAFERRGGGGYKSLGFGSGPTGPGPTDEHSVHPHHRDFIVTLIADQIRRIDSVSKTEYYDLKNHFSEPKCKMTVLPLNSGTCVTLNGSGIQLVVGPQPLWLWNHNSGPAQRIMVRASSNIAP